MSDLKAEIENLAHTLTDIKAVLRCGNTLVGDFIEVRENLIPRIDRLEERVDRLAREYQNES